MYFLFFYRWQSRSFMRHVSISVPRRTKQMSRLAAITAVAAFLISSEGVHAFGVAAAPVGGGAAKPQSHDRPSFPRRVLILPDSRAEVLDRDLWHHHLKASTPDSRSVLSCEQLWRVSPCPSFLHSSSYLWNMRVLALEAQRMQIEVGLK